MSHIKCPKGKKCVFSCPFLSPHSGCCIAPHLLATELYGVAKRLRIVGSIKSASGSQSGTQGIKCGHLSRIWWEAPTSHIALHTQVSRARILAGEWVSPNPTPLRQLLLLKWLQRHQPHGLKPPTVTLSPLFLMNPSALNYLPLTMQECL